MTIASRVEEANALCLSRDARLVGIRWDAVAWGIVLDLDSPRVRSGEGADEAGVARVPGGR